MEFLKNAALTLLNAAIVGAVAFAIGFVTNVIVLARTAEVFSVTTGLWLAAGFAALIVVSSFFELADKYPGL